MKNILKVVLVFGLINLNYSCYDDGIDSELEYQSIENEILEKSLNSNLFVKSRFERSNKINYLEFDSMEDAISFIKAHKIKKMTKEEHVLSNNIRFFDEEGNELRKEDVLSPTLFRSLSSCPITELCDSPDQGGGCDTRRGRVLISSYSNITTGYQVDFAYSDSDSNGHSYGSDFQSDMIGFTLGVSWEHNSGYSYTDEEGSIHYTIRGIQNYNLFVEGVGTVYSEPVTIKGHYNPCSGSYSIRIN